jgi:hypothetical protein
VGALIQQWRDGDITFAQLKAAFATRSWPEPRTTGSRTDGTLDFGPPGDGSWQDVYIAHDLGLLTDDQYRQLADAVTQPSAR